MADTNNVAKTDKMNLSKDMFEVVGKDAADYEKIVRPSLTYWADAWRRLKENKLAIFSLILLIIIVVMAFIGPKMRPWEYDYQDFTVINKGPNSVHWFGTDELGRDIFVRCWEGAKVSLFIALISTVINVTIGILYGGISGYVGGYTDMILMRIVEIIYSIPTLLWVILLMVVLGQGLGTIIIAISITGWGGMARIVRGQVLQLKQMEFVLAAKTLGADSSRIITRHLVPNTMGPIIINLTFQVPGAIFTEAMLSYIGLGLPEPYASWGTLAQRGARLFLIYPYQLAFPAVLICVTMLAFNLLGDGLRDSLDPRLRT